VHRIPRGSSSSERSVDLLLLLLELLLQHELLLIGQRPLRLLRPAVVPAAGVLLQLLGCNPWAPGVVAVVAVGLIVQAGIPLKGSNVRTSPVPQQTHRNGQKARHTLSVTCCACSAGGAKCFPPK
jgi:hypothetical protein